MRGLAQAVAAYRSPTPETVVVAAVALLLALVISLLEPLWGAILVAGLFVVLATLVKPEVGLVLTVFAVPFGSVREVPLGAMTVSAAEGLVGLLLFGWIARAASRRTLDLSAAPLVWPLGLFLAFAVFSLTTATSLPLALKEVLRWLELTAVYVVVATSIRGDRIRLLVLTILAAGLAQALQGFYQFFMRVGPPSFAIGPFLRAYGSFEQPNPYAGYLGMVLPFAFAIALLYRSEPCKAVRDFFPLRRWPWLRLMAYATLGAAVVAMVMSLSRGAWLAGAFALAVVALASSRRAFLIGTTILVVAALVLAVGALNLLPSEIVSRAAKALDSFSIFDVRSAVPTGENWAIFDRMARWQATWSMFEASPLLGVGIGNYADAYPRYALPGWEEALGHAHNIYLNIAAETGIIGLALYLLLIGSWFWHAGWLLAALSRQGNRPSGSERAVALGALGVLTALAVHNVFDNLYVHSMNVQIGITLGIVSALGAEMRTGNLKERL